MPKDNKKKKNIIVEKDGRCVIIEEISKFAEKIYLPYAVTTNLARITPEVRDGLKPVQRRIVYAMVHDKGRKPSLKANSLIKVAAVVGVTIEKYHPHSDGSIYEALLSLAQWWKSTPCIIRPHGNFGSISGNSAAAQRYIECNISHFGYDTYFNNFDPMMIDYKSNYSGTCLEPEFLPSAFPIVLIRGALGIGTGISSMIPKYNLVEVANLTMELMDNPNKKKCVLIPDYPSGCEIVKTDFEKISMVGEGSITTRSSMEVDEDGNLIITSIPNNTTLFKIIDDISNLKNSGKLDLIDMKDETTKTAVNPINMSNETDIRLKLFVKKGSDINEIKEILYKGTACKNTDPVRMNLVYDYEMIRYNIKSYLIDWIEFRRETLMTSLIKQYSDKNKRYMLLETIIKVLSKPNADKLITDLARKSDDRATLINAYIKEFKINDLQAEVIADFKTHQRSKSAIKKYKEEYDILSGELDKLYHSINTDGEIDVIIKQELNMFKKKYGEPRRCKVVEDTSSNYVPDTMHYISISKNGLIKKVTANDVEGVYDYVTGDLDSKDAIVDIINISNRKKVLVFTAQGRCLGFKVNELLSSGLDTIGTSLTNMGMSSGDRPVSLVEVPDKETTNRYLFLTKKGMVKISKAALYTKAGKNSLIAMNVAEKDEVAKVVVLGHRNSDVVIFTKKGAGLRFNTKQITATQRNSMGVIGSKVPKGDSFKGICVVGKNDNRYVALSDKGVMKVSDLPVSNLRTKSCSALMRLEGDKLIDIKAFQYDKNSIQPIITVVKNSGIESVFSGDIKKTSKIDSGKKIISKRNSENIIKIL